jgi:RNA polymerase sigma-70 factor (ECF subfamily)
MEKDARRARDTWIAYRCQLGEPEGFELLVAEMERPLFYYVLKLLGDQDAAVDVLQEIWLKVFRTIHALRAPEALRTWLYRVARGTALNRVRGDSARSREEPLEEADATTTRDPGLRPDEALDLHAALDRLDRRHREVLVLLFLEGLTVDEIARVVGVPAGTVKSRIHHGKRALAALLEGRGHE